MKKKVNINRDELFNQYVDDWKKRIYDINPDDVKFQTDMLEFMISKFNIEDYLESLKVKEYLKKCKEELQPGDFFFEDF